MWGTSYSAHVQANAAKLKPPHLKTIVVNMGGMSNGWEIEGLDAVSAISRIAVSA